MSDTEREGMMQLEPIGETEDYEEEFPFDNTFVTVTFELYERCEAAAAKKKMHPADFIRLSLWSSVLKVEQEDVTC